MTPSSTILDSLLGLSRVHWSDPRTTLGWRFPVPAWAWVVIACAAAAVAVWSYRRIAAPVGKRAFLAVTRALLILFLAALLAGPMLVLSQDQVEPDWLLVLVDRSASMRVKDMPANSGGAPGTTPVASSNTSPGESISRDDALKRALASHADLFGPDKLAKNRRILWLGFDSTTYEVAAPEKPADAAKTSASNAATNPSDAAPVLPASTQKPANGNQPVLPEPDGQATMIRTAIEQALQRGAGRAIAGVVLFSDFRSPQATAGDLTHRLQQQAVSLFPVPLGAKESPLDLAVTQVDAPEKAFINDTVPVSVYLEKFPPEAKLDPARVKVKLIDLATNKTLDERSPTDPALREPVHLSTDPTVVGQARWRVEVVCEPPGDAPSQRELVTENNRADIALELIDRPLRVLYVEGYPRWEYRFLKNMLVREKSIESSMMLISADRSFAQEGSLPITRLPRTAEELRPYDVVIIGDVPATYFQSDELTMLRDHVATRGAGLLWIAGGSDTPRSWEGTALAPLLPMRRPAAVDRADPTLGAMLMRPTPLAESLSVLKLRGGANASAAGAPAWPDKLPPFWWAQQLGELKPSAEVLAESYGHPGKPLPLLVRIRYGAGQALFAATDETWRWRYGRGELFFEQYWLQLIRMLARSRLQQGTDRAVLTVSNRRLEVDQAAVVHLRINDELLAQRELPRISVAVTRLDAPGKENTPVERIDLVRKSSGNADANTADPATRVLDVAYEAIWRPATPGRLQLRVNEPAMDDLNITQSVEVIRPDDELRQPLPDRQRPVALAKDTGGAVVELDRLDDLATLVPNRARRTPNDLREPLGDSFLSLMIVLALLTAEWVGRKMIRLA